jgi:betaine-aldehyde dehydrogenase
MIGFSTQLFIDGERRAGKSSRTIVQINPASEEQFCAVAVATRSDVEDAVAGANRAFFEQWRDLPPRKRTDLLFRLAHLIRKNSETLAQLECRNIGKPISDARDEIELGARVFEYYAGAIGKFFGQTIPVGRGGFDFTLHQPMGVIAAIVPWNFPFPIACWKAAPALAAGNTVVLKPASQSPLTAIALGELAHEAGFPPGTLQVVPGEGREIGDALVQHPLVRKISFTGSTAVGARIMALAAPDLKRVSLELGGKSPNIIFADSDLEQAAGSGPMSVFGNTGQDCCARSRIFVEKSVFDQFLELFVDATKKLIVGDPTQPETQVGPLVSSGQRHISEKFIEEARSQGRKIVAGGKRPFAKGFYLEPTVLIDVETSDRVWCEEVFGPVVSLRPFTDETEMLAEVNASPYGLSGSIWTNNLQRALRVARAVESGARPRSYFFEKAKCVSSESSLIATSWTPSSSSAA